MRELPNVYQRVKMLTQSYENRKRGYLLRREAGEINRDQEFALVQRLDHELKYELDRVIGKIDDGELDGEAEPDTEPENAEVVNG